MIGVGILGALIGGVVMGLIGVVVGARRLNHDWRARITERQRGIQEGLPRLQTRAGKALELLVDLCTERGIETSVVELTLREITALQLARGGRVQCATLLEGDER